MYFKYNYHLMGNSYCFLSMVKGPLYRLFSSTSRLMREGFLGVQCVVSALG